MALPSPMTKREQAAAWIRDGITSGRLAPGERVVIDAVAREIGMSAIPVREALGELESEGLVENRPHVGPVVTAVSRDDVREVFELLGAVEGVAGRYACERIADEEVAEIAALVAAMDQIVADDDQEAWAERNSEFHLAMARAARMPLLVDVTARALARWRWIRQVLFAQVRGENLAAVNGEHRKMVAALKERDASRLSRLIAQHNGGALRHYLKSKATGG